MQTKFIGILSLICLALTVLWLVLLFSGVAVSGSFETFDQILDYVNNADILFYATYANAALVTVSAMMLFSVFYLYYKSIAPGWSTIGLMFVPVYGTMNLVVYLSQITVVPRLVKLHSMSIFESSSQFVLRQMIQQWPDSMISIVNNLAYAVLGVPSIIFGVLMFKTTASIRIGGVLLLLNGIVCIAGFIGIIAQNAWLSRGSLVGGVLFLLALIALSWGFLRFKPSI